MDSSEKHIVEKITKIRQAYNHPKASLQTLKPFAIEVGVPEEEWMEILEIFHNHLERGGSFIKHNNWDDAIEELEVAYQLDPAHEDTLLELATAHQNRWWKKRRTSDKKQGIKYAELSLEINPKNKTAAGIITDLKQAPFEFWIHPKTQWKLAKYTFWLVVLGGMSWYYVTHKNQINQWALSFMKPKTENSSLPRPKEVHILKTVIFASGSAFLPETTKSELNYWAGRLKENPKLKMEIAGHTDNTGIPAQNQQISELRAKAVHDYLINQGVPPTQLSYKGYGDTQQLFLNDSEENMAKNRRIELREL
jgi:outer membrane protein OmpA-like peptidoglycan-associated protein